MTPTEQLTERLEALGMTVEGIFPARGFWTHMHQDVMRWTAHVRVPGTPGVVTLGSWHTITVCARRGITYDPKADGDRGNITANDPRPRKRSGRDLAPSPAVTTIPRMKDAVAFLAFMRGLVPDSTVSLTLGDSGLTVTISNRVTGRWYGYILDADDLEKPSAGLADELVRIHENRSRGDDKHPILPHADLERMRETAREGWETARLLAVTYCARASEKKANEELAKLGRSATPYGTPHDLVPGLEQANTEAHRAIAKLKARLARTEAERDSARRWGYLEVKREYAPGCNIITSEEEDERSALQARAEAEHWGASKPSAADGLPVSADECSEDPPVRCGTFTCTAPQADESVAEEGSVQVVNTNTATADERERVGLTLEASQRAFLKAWGWTSNGTGLWADPWKEVVNFAWDGDMAVAEQNNRKEGVSSSSPPLRGKGDARPTYSIADSMERIKLAAQYGHSPGDLTVDLYAAIVAELDRALAAGRQ